MKADEFLALPETSTPTELLGGVVVMSPAPKVSHQITLSSLVTLIKLLVPDGLVLFAPTDVLFDENNIVQPDLLWISENNTACQLIEDAYWKGPPDLIIEVLSPGSARRDKQEKFELYQKHGVQEYWIADPAYQVIEVWQLENKVYSRMGVFGKNDTFTPSVLGEKSIQLTDVF
jgi:Uma2 family endonuclease